MAPRRCSRVVPTAAGTSSSLRQHRRRTRMQGRVLLVSLILVRPVLLVHPIRPIRPAQPTPLADLEHSAPIPTPTHPQIRIRTRVASRVAQPKRSATGSLETTPRTDRTPRRRGRRHQRQKPTRVHRQLIPPRPLIQRPALNADPARTRVGSQRQDRSRSRMSLAPSRSGQTALGGRKIGRLTARLPPLPGNRRPRPLAHPPTRTRGPWTKNPFRVHRASSGRTRVRRRRRQQWQTVRTPRSRMREASSFRRTSCRRGRRPVPRRGRHRRVVRGVMVVQNSISL